MDPITIIIGGIIGGIVAAAIWETLTNFLCRVIETILPNRYGEAISRFVRKVIGIVRKAISLHNYAEMIAEVLEASGSTYTMDSEYVEWSEVPSDIKSQIESRGCYEYSRSV